MKTLRKIRKSTKALSPVVASIILIAVTVAVSIAVAAWMGALTVGFMDTEELKITQMEFVGGATPTSIDLSVSNIGTSPVTITVDAYVNGQYAPLAAEVTFQANADGTVSIPYTTWVQGDNYQVRITSTKGNTFTYTAVAPD
jgi:flagellin-like protein